MSFYLNISRQAAPAPQPACTNVTKLSNELLEAKVVFAVVVMAILAGVMSVVGVERLIRGRFTLFSTVRFLLRSSFLLSLPLLSSMSRDPAHADSVLFVLLWMLLIELLSKKAFAMVRSSGGEFSRATAGGRFRLTDHYGEVTNLAWIGWLIFQNTYYSKSLNNGGEGKTVVAMFAVLWSLVLTKLVQRVFNERKAQESLTAAGNTHLIAGYMQHVVENASSGDADALARCKYVVMGEEKLVVHTANKKKMKKKRDGGGDDNVVTITTHGCGYGVGRYPNHQSEQKHVNLLVDLAKSGEVVTIDEITNKIKVPDWCCCFTGRRFTDHMHQLCFSFSLFKLLRRRFEHYPMVEAGTKTSKQLLLDKLLAVEGGAAKKTFRVMRQELDFLDSYYDPGAPVAMSSPWLFIFNYFFSLVFVSTYLVAVIIVLLEMKNAQLSNNLPLYFAISILLVATLIAVEFTELLTSYILSNWFMVHLLCLLAGDGGGLIWTWAFKPAIRLFIAGRYLLFYSFQCMLWLSCRGTNVDTIKIKQVSILRVCEPIHKLLSWSPQVKLATDGETAIVKFLEKVVRDSVDDNKDLQCMLSGLELKKGAETATQVILACHLATELLEMKHVVMVDKKAKKKKATRKMNRDERRDYRLHRGVATALSRYCMYLVARSPELLPDNERWVSDRYGDMKDFLKEASRRRCCCCCPFRLWKCGCWRTVLMDMDADDVADPAAKAGVKLFRELDKADAASAAWEGLFDFWTKMVVYIAPSNDVEGHASALAGNGGDLITYLWALCTHAGIIRDPSDDKSPEGGQV
uniref:DUF4220 domain-containing protein n=1 Tax=Oryza nivara TaxID=4536 RepID=A0A0E0HY63_ORYNI